MEIKEEVQVEIDKNQISFDFLDKNDAITLEQAESFDWVADETLVVIVKAKGDVSYNFDICGKKMIDWISLSTSGCKQKCIDEPSEDDFLSTIKDLGEGYSFVAVFFSDTPLLKKDTFLEIMDYFSKHRMNVLKLKRGYIFRAEYLQTAKMLLSSTITEFGEEDFMIVDKPQKISDAFKILQQRILSYHRDRGVVFFGQNTIFIDADVEIEEGCVIYPNNIIKGESYIGKNVILESGNYIFDTIVCDEAFICQSYLEKSKVEKGRVVGPFARIINEKV